MAQPPRSIVSMASQHEQATLSKGQKTFNRLIAQIEQRRAQLAAWESMLPRYQKKFSEKFLPLENSLTQLRIQLLKLLSGARAKKGLTRSERKQIDQYIVGMIADIAEASDGEIDAELKALYNLHSRSDFDADIAEERVLFAEVVREVTGVERDLDEEFDSSDEFMERAARRFAEQHAQAEQAQAERQAKRKKTAKQTAREAAREAEEKSVSDSLREVYRKLASALHPDREPDPAERERKNALMQKANKAYDSGNLLQLLELQLELEQIDPAALVRMSEDKLKRYNVILKDQVRELDMELAHVEESFSFRFGVVLFPKAHPDVVLKDLDVEIRERTEAARDLERDLRTLHEVNTLKAFLRAVRQAERDDFDDMLF